ncbi:hypothetical protein B0H14DRAFT_3462953 [Mycena olivaceomarginata]|nr:hypothetical protein B0H14DRAFT_3462953 [Mycena olivaceomarginata]
MMYTSTTPVDTHGSSCPKCGAASDGSAKSCSSCGASLPQLSVLIALRLSRDR